MLFQFLFQWINQFSKCNEQHSNPNDADVKRTILSTQTKLNYFFNKATFKRFKKYLRFTSIERDLMNLQMQKDAQEAITQNNEGIQANQTTDKKQQEILTNKTHFLFFRLFLENKMREDSKCDSSMINRAVKQVNRASKLDWSLYNQIWLSWGEKLQKTIWN